MAEVGADSSRNGVLVVLAPFVAEAARQTWKALAPEMEGANDDVREILEQAIACCNAVPLDLSCLKRQFDLDDAYLDDLKYEIIGGNASRVDEPGTVFGMDWRR